MPVPGPLDIDPHWIVIVEEFGALNLSLRLLKPPKSSDIDMFGLMTEPVEITLELVADESLHRGVPKLI